MKKFKLKILLPIVAVMLALGASAFTSNTNVNPDAEMAIQGYVFNANPQQPCNEVQVDCSITGAYLCTSGSQQVYRLQSGTSCTAELRKTTP